MNIDSFKSLTIKEKDVYRRIYARLKEGKPLTDEEFNILMKAYTETSDRMGFKNEDSV